MSTGLSSPLQAAETVTFKAPVQPLNVILERLSGEIGRELHVAQEGPQHYLYIDVTDVTVSELLNAISESTKSVWAESGTSLHLVPATTLRRQEALAERNAILAELQRQINITVSPEQMEELSGDVRQDVESYAAVREIVRAADLNAVASMAPGDRIVFADRPNNYQRALRGNVSRQKAMLIAGINEDRGDMDSVFGDEFFLELRNMMDLLGMSEDEFAYHTKPIDAAQSKMVLIVTRSERYASAREGANAASDFMFEVAFLDAQGRTAGNAYAPLGARARDREPSLRDVEVGYAGDTGSEMTVTVETEGGEFYGGVDEEEVPYEIEYPEAVHYLKEKTGYFSSADIEPPAKPELEEILLNPEIHDPLALVCVPIFEKVAPTLGSNVVLYVTDHLITRNDYGSLELPRTAESGAGWLSTVVDIRDEGAVVVGVPRNLDLAMSERLNRAQLGRFLRTNYDELVVGLDSLADFAQYFNDPVRISWVSATTQLLTPLHDSWIGGMSIEGAKLYGLMNSSTRARIRRGESVRFMELGAATVRAIEEMILDGDLSLGSIPKPVDTSASEVDRRVINQFRGLMFGDMMFGGGDYERTEILGMTNPQMALISVQLFQSPCLVPVTEEGKRVKSQPILSDFELGLISTFMEQFSDDPEMLTEFEDLKHVKPGERDLIMMQMVLTPWSVSSATVYDDRVNPNTRIESLDSWLSRFPEVNAAVKRIMDSAGFLDFGGPEYRATPP